MDEEKAQDVELENIWVNFWKHYSSVQYYQVLWIAGSLKTLSMSLLLILVGIIRKQGIIMNIYVGEQKSLNSNYGLFL